MLDKHYILDIERSKLKHAEPPYEASRNPLPNITQQRG